MVAVGAGVAPEAITAAVAAPSPLAPAISVVTPPTVTRGAGTEVLARLTSPGGVPLPARTVQFVSRAPGATAWTLAGTADTDFQGYAALAVAHINAPTEYGAYYAGLVAGVARSATDSAVIHVIDVAPKAPAKVAYNTSVHLVGHLLRDSAGIAGQRVQFYFRATPKTSWSAAQWGTTDANGLATLTHRSGTSFQVGIRFPGRGDLAASPLRVASVAVAARPRSASGYVFPFRYPRQAQSSGSWSQDQGVDLAANGWACGTQLVAMGPGTVVQTGISGFGPTAPVIRLSAGPWRGRNLYYGHTGRIYVHTGQRVATGQLVAQIGCGSVGYSSAPHLEIGIGVPGGPTCCPGWHQTSSAMWNMLISTRRAA